MCVRSINWHTKFQKQTNPSCKDVENRTNVGVSQKLLHERKRQDARGDRSTQEERRRNTQTMSVRHSSTWTVCKHTRMYTKKDQTTHKLWFCVCVWAVLVYKAVDNSKSPIWCLRSEEEGKEGKKIHLLNNMENGNAAAYPVRIPSLNRKMAAPDENNKLVKFRKYILSSSDLQSSNRFDWFEKRIYFIQALYYTTRSLCRSTNSILDHFYCFTKKPNMNWFKCGAVCGWHTMIVCVGVCGLSVCVRREEKRYKHSQWWHNWIMTRKNTEETLCQTSLKSRMKKKRS